MAQVAFSFATSEVIKVVAGVSMGMITGQFIVGGVAYNPAAKGIGCRISETGGMTIFNAVSNQTMAHIYDRFPGKGYRCNGISVVMSSGEAEIYLL